MPFSRLTKYLDLIPEVYGIPLCELSVRHNHELVYRHSVGDLPHGENTLYKLFSMTKLFTVTAAMQLIEEGKLGLDDPVYKYIPAYKKLTVLQNGRAVPAKTVMTIRHLLSMRSGLSYNSTTPCFAKACENEFATTRELMEALAGDPLLFNPGENWFYSLSHDVLAAVMEVICGMKFSEILKSKIMNPLEISDMGFFPTDEQLSRFVPMYEFDANTFTVFPTDTELCRYSKVFESGGGGLFGSNNEYMKLPDALANGGTAANGYQILKPETINLIKGNQMPPSEVKEFYTIKPGYGYGLGVRTLVDPEEAQTIAPIGEFGWDGAAASYWMVDTDNHIAVVWTTHVRECRPAYREIHPHIRNLVYDALKK